LKPIIRNIAFIEYKLVRGLLFLLHTGVPPGSRTKGVASAAVQKAFQDAEDNNYKIVPICAFVQHLLEKRKEYTGLVAPDAERLIHKT
jgi:uncharacterized protein